MKKLFLALAVLAYGYHPATASIVYTDIIPDATFMMTASSAASLSPIDMNNDAAPEFAFRYDVFTGATQYFLHITRYGSVSQMLRKGTSNPYGAPYLQNLAAGDTIKPAPVAPMNWGYGSPEPLLGDSYDPNMFGAGDRYIGVQFPIAGNTYYGWIRVNVTNTMPITVTVKDYAYENTPNTRIIAGDMGAAPITIPSITLAPVSGVTATGATVNGTVNPNGGTTTVSVQYGLTTGYGSTMSTTPASVSGTTAQAVSSTLAGLAAGTLYHYRISATNSAGAGFTADATFTTSTPVSLPTITVAPVSGITATGATVNGTVNANGGTTAISVQYGTTTSYGSAINPSPSTVTGSAAQLVSAVLSGLAAGTVYHYRISATNSAGTTNSADGIFTTISTAPIVTLSSVTNITATGAQIHGTVDPRGSYATVSVQYGLTTAYGSTVSTIPATIAGIASTVYADLTGLMSNKVYHYRIVATGGNGTTYSADATFSTKGLSVATLSESGFSLYPNPAANVLRLKLKEPMKDISLAIADLMGRAMAVPVEQMGAGEYAIGTGALAPGVYQLIIVSGSTRFAASFLKH